jgi:hypothetical protein
MESFDALMWSNLEQLGRGTVRLDIRGGVDRSRLPGFMKLYERGCCTLVETGPGDSVHIFKITPAGQALLDERT